VNSLVETKKVLLGLRIVDLDAIHALPHSRGVQLGLPDGVAVYVLDQYGLAEGWFVVMARASVPVPARANFEVEWAIDPVFFGSVYASQMACHVCVRIYPRGGGECGHDAGAWELMRV